MMSYQCCQSKRVLLTVHMSLSCVGECLPSGSPRTVFQTLIIIICVIMLFVMKLELHRKISWCVLCCCL